MHEDEEGKKHARMNMPFIRAHEHDRPETTHFLPVNGTGNKMVRKGFLGNVSSKYIVGMIYESLFRARGLTFWKCSTALLSGTLSELRPQLTASALLASVQRVSFMRTEATRSSDWNRKGYC